MKGNIPRDAHANNKEMKKGSQNSKNRSLPPRLTNVIKKKNKKNSEAISHVSYYF